LSFIRISINLMFFFICFFRRTALALQLVQQEVQAQAPPHRARPLAHGRKAVRLPKVLQEVLTLRLLQPAHQPQVRQLQAALGSLPTFEQRRQGRRGPR